MNKEINTWLKGRKIRKVSNKWNWIKLLLFMQIYVLVPLPEKIKNLNDVEMGEYIKTLVLAFAKAGLLIGIIFVIFCICMNFKVNKRLKNLPYAFDYQLELNTYKNIGLKKTKGKIEVQKFERYTKWKEYILLKYKILMNNEDFYRFLKRTLRNKKTEKEMMTGLVTPVEVGILTIFFTVNSGMDEMEIMFSLIILSLTIVVVVLYGILGAKNEIDFIEDFVEIIFPNKIVREKKEDN